MVKTGLLGEQGYQILPLDGLQKKKKRIYYHPGTGEPTCLLPADKYHTRLFLRQGFTLEPPEKPKEIPSGVGKCPVCGKTCKRVRQHFDLAHKKVD